jgi:hypothetical protein
MGSREVLKRKRQKPRGLWRFILDVASQRSCPSCPAALTPVWLAPRLRPCLEPGLHPALLDPILQLSSSAGPAALPSARLAPRLQPCLGSASRPNLGNLPTTLAACSCPPALPSARLAPRQRPCLELVSSLRLLQYIRPEPATSRRPVDSLAAVAPWFGLAPIGSCLSACAFPWHFGLALSSDSRPLPRASLSGWVSTQSLRPSPPLNPPAAFRLRRSTPGSRPSSPAFPSGQPSGLPLSVAPALAFAPSF